MSCEVIVAFGAGREHEFRVLDGELKSATADWARRWMDDEWSALECEPSNPMGKVLLLDKILGVAKYAGEKRFTSDLPWAQTYAAATALLLDRRAIRVDIAENRVG